MKSVVLGEKRIVPTKIVCIGRNYVEHIHELGNDIPDDMVVFLKPNSAMSTVLLSEHQGEALHYETELCFMFQDGRFSSVAVGLDLTKRDLQSKLKAKGLPWERAKAFDGAALFSPFVAIDDAEAPLHFTLSINDNLVQEGHIDLMIYKPQTILSELQAFISLDEGDIVMTGTPKGVGVIPAKSVFNVTLSQGLQASAEPLLEWQWQVS
ncbi:fumarylacetoacetate hydrolase family protein [Shewanella baltica]|uniref:fumarylacetoacetate hydrolase family protein n=1 Tax=Shewanella baltica TaxID=62322 RepID=UPI00217E6A3A|nr:fumarylacetoacetate hydrolase family protein [Shewanella baltica]MCS6117602.1 fumarylacetoacetate hydrolase family protein [Shewanella baltica]